jgi:hypothetical protein
MDVVALRGYAGDFIDDDVRPRVGPGISLFVRCDDRSGGIAT